MSNVVDKKSSIQVRIDRGLHEILNLIAKKHSISIKTLLEGYIADGLVAEKGVLNEKV